jgi:hypothetical protein
MAVGDLITATRYNSMQSTLANVLGTGSGNRGYGQTVTSAAVSVGSQVTATDMSNLRADLRKTYIHQTGVYPTSDLINSGDTVLDTDASTGKGWTEYEDFITSLDSNRLTADATRMSTTNKISYTRGSTWNGTVTHTFTATFANTEDRRFYFNSGGEIRIALNIPGGSPTAKDNDWNAMFTAMGTLKFAESSSRTGVGGTFTQINNTNVTTSPQTIFAANGSGVYSDSDFDITVAVDAGGTVFTFVIVVRDDSTEVLDEDVTDMSITTDEFKANSGLGDGLTITSATFSGVTVT